jgi:hypothetical protein
MPYADSTHCIDAQAHSTSTVPSIMRNYSTRAIRIGSLEVAIPLPLIRVINIGQYLSKGRFQNSLLLW